MGFWHRSQKEWMSKKTFTYKEVDKFMSNTTEKKFSLLYFL